MRWLVAGASGMLGRDLVSVLTGAGADVTALNRDELDVTDAAAADRATAGHDVVINCSAYTAVDAAESDEAAAFAVNAIGAANLARAVARRRARIVQVSTDYVFDGSSRTPYGERDAIAPASAYGRTKAAGEWAVRAEAPDHLIVRTAWLYGEHGPCFPKTIARVASERGQLDVVADQVGQPTWTVDLARLIVQLVEVGAPTGTYHGTSSGAVSWHGFARAVVASAGLDPDLVRPTTAAAFVRSAPRPAYSVLGHDALRRVGVEPIADWETRWQLAAPDVLGDRQSSS